MYKREDEEEEEAAARKEREREEDSKHGMARKIHMARSGFRRREQAGGLIYPR